MALPLRWSCQRNNQRSPKTLLFVFRRFPCRPAAFLAVWGGQTERETPLADHKLHAARVRVCVGLAALTGVGCGIGGQPVLEVGVVCANIDQRLFLVKPYIGGFFLLGKGTDNDGHVQSPVPQQAGGGSQTA